MKKLENKYNYFFNLGEQEQAQLILKEKEYLKQLYGEEMIEPNEETIKQTHREKFQRLCNSIKQRTLETDRDTVISVTGEEGEGKSHWSIRLAKGIDKEFNLEEQMLFDPNPKDFYDLIFHKLKPGSVVILDEAIKVLNKRRWQSAGNIGITVAMNVMRKQNKVLILNMPSFDQFDTIPRNNRIYVNFNIPHRGLAVEFAKFNTPFTNTDPWFLEENTSKVLSLCKGKPFNSLTKMQKINVMKKCKGFMDYYLFEELPPKLKARYDKIAMEIQEKMSFGDVKTEDKSKDKERINRLEDSLALSIRALRDQGLTNAEICRVTKYSQSFIINLLKEKGVPSITDSGFVDGKKVRD